MESENECEFCRKKFATKSSLNKHRKTAEYCLYMRKEHVKQNNSCPCGKTYTRKNSLYRHMITCKVPDIIERAVEKNRRKSEEAVMSLVSEYDNKIDKIKSEYENKIGKMKSEYENEFQKMKSEYENKIEKMNDRLENIAMKAIDKPTISNTTNTSHITMTPFIMEDVSIKHTIEEFYNLDYMRKGHRGVAEFTKEKLLLDDKGKLKYVCCDPSRMIFKYKDEVGEIRKDVKATRLSKKITPNIMTKAHSIVIDEVNKIPVNESTRNVEFYDMYFKLKELETKPEKLGSELSKIIT